MSTQSGFYRKVALVATGVVATLGLGFLFQRFYKAKNGDSVSLLPFIHLFFLLGLRFRAAF